MKRLLGACLALALAAGLGLWTYGRLIQYEPGDTVTIDFAADPDQARSEVGLLTGRGDFFIQQCCAHSFAHRTVNGGKAALFTVGVDDPHVKGNFRSEARLLSNRWFGGHSSRFSPRVSQPSTGLRAIRGIGWRLT